MGYSACVGAYRPHMVTAHKHSVQSSEQLWQSSVKNVYSEQEYMHVLLTPTLDSCQTSASVSMNFDTCSKTPLVSEVTASDSFDTVHHSSTYENNLQAGRNTDILGTPGNTVPNFQSEFCYKETQ